MSGLAILLESSIQMILILFTVFSEDYEDNNWVILFVNILVVFDIIFAICYIFFGIWLLILDIPTYKFLNYNPPAHLDIENEGNRSNDDDNSNDERPAQVQRYDSMGHKPVDKN